MAYVDGLSGSFEISGKPFSGRITWTETYDLITNSSIVTIQSIEVKSSNWYDLGYYPSGNIKIDSVQVGSMSSSSGTHYVYISRQNTYYEIKASGDQPFTPWVSGAISHNADGTKKILVEVSIGLYTISGGNDSGKKFTGSVEIELTSIPRAATIVSAPNFNDETSDLIIELSNPAGNAVDKLEACISLTGATDDIEYREIPDKTATSYTFSLTESELDLLRAATNSGSASRTLLFRLRTTIGGVSYVKQVSRLFTVINADPTMDVFYEDINSDTTALTGDPHTFVRGYSNLMYTIDATAYKGASIIQYNAECGGLFSDESADVFPNVQSSTISFRVLDTRGLSDLVEHNLTIVPYSKPTCAMDLSLELVEGTVSKAVVTVSGTYYAGSFGATNNQLIVEASYTGSNGWVNVSDSNELVVTDNSYRLTFTVYDLDYRNAFTCQCRVIDSLDSTTSASDSKSIWPAFDWDSSSFNFNVPVHLNDTLAMKVDSEGNLVISCKQKSILLRPNGDSSESGQLVLSKDGTATLGSRQIATVDLLYPVGSIYLSVNDTNPAIFFGGTWERIQDKFLLAAGSSYGAGTTGGSTTHTHTLSDAAIALINHHDGKFWFAEIEGVNYNATGSGSATGAVVNTAQTAAVPLGGKTDSASTLPPYLVVYVWKRTA